jgi:hypothetical protein
VSAISRSVAGSHAIGANRLAGSSLRISVDPSLTYFSMPSNTRNLALAPGGEADASREQEAPLPMSVRGTGRTSRQRRRARKRALGVTLVFLGILLWGGTALMRATAGHLAPEAIIYLGITGGGAAVVVGILLVSTSL